MNERLITIEQWLQMYRAYRDAPSDDGREAAALKAWWIEWQSRTAASNNEE